MTELKMITERDITNSLQDQANKYHITKFDEFNTELAGTLLLDFFRNGKFKENIWNDKRVEINLYEYKDYTFKVAKYKDENSILLFYP